MELGQNAFRKSRLWVSMPSDRLAMFAVDGELGTRTTRQTDRDSNDVPKRSGGMQGGLLLAPLVHADGRRPRESCLVFSLLIVELSCRNTPHESTLRALVKIAQECCMCVPYLKGLNESID